MKKLCIKNLLSKDIYRIKNEIWYDTEMANYSWSQMWYLIPDDIMNVETLSRKILKISKTHLQNTEFT